MDTAVRIVTLWTGPLEAHVTLEGQGGDPCLETLLGAVLEHVFTSGARHLFVSLHRLTGEDTGVVELLAATSHRFRHGGGAVEVYGLRHRLASRPEVAHFPEVFGTTGAAPAPTRVPGTPAERLGAARASTVAR